MKKGETIIADEILRNQLNLLRFTAGEKKRVFALLLDMQKELKLKLQNGFTSNEKVRLTKLLNQCTMVMHKYYSGIQQELNLSEVATIESKATVKAIAAIDIDVAMPTAAVMKSLVSDTLLQGAPLADWWAKQAEDTAFKFASQVRQGVAQGETLNQIVGRIVGDPKHGTVGIMDVARRNASTLTHDAVMQISNDARMATFKENSDIVKGLRQLSTLDSRTSAVCVAYSGAVWDIDGKPIGGNTLPFNSGCPRHPNCRSVIVPMLASYKELGIDIPEKEPGTRASDIGQVPSDMSFDAFLQRHSKAYQDEILGKGKAELWRSGTITLSDLLSQAGRPLTLKQLAEAA